jgi:hypothetical protein
MTAAQQSTYYTGKFMFRANHGGIGIQT